MHQVLRMLNRKKRKKKDRRKREDTNKLYALIKRVFHKTNSKQCLYERILRKKSNQLTATFDTQVL